ncbi:zinc finger protein 62 homolog isoform X5 [Atheta coriaria]|uniref:zinc finger protein 62 homolog isoform X5 n=1 Tax=Dalotia coriaria TaxID=877792 RepID=UPI0031F353C6
MTTYAEMMQMCRLCLVKEQVNLPIFDGQGEVQQIFLKITACLPVKVSREDNLPKNICDGCSYKLDLLYQFWNTSSNSEKQLIDWLTAAGVEPKQKSNEPIGLATQPNVILKQEPVTDLDARSSDAIDAISSDTQNYIIQQQQLAYKPEEYDESQQNLSNSTKKKAAADPNDESVSKRPRRSSSYVSTVKDYEDDSDEDYVDNTDAGIAKTEDESEEDDDDEDEDLEDEGDDMADPDFVAKEEEEDSQQPGPSGTKTTSGPRRRRDAFLGGTKNMHRFFCFLCNTENPVMNRAELTEHYNSQHPESRVIYRRIEDFAKLSHVCDICDMSFETIMEAEKHINQHEDQHSCDHCGAKFIKTLEYAIHLFEHTKSAKCEFCSVMLKNKKKMNVHYAVHLKSMKPFVCELAGCERRFTTLSRLRDHQERHKGEPSYNCEICAKKYLTETNLKSHINSVHPELKTGKIMNYACKLCEQSFKYNMSLKRHVDRVHCNVNGKFQCEKCAHFYSSEEYLKYHLKTVHKPTEYEGLACEVCKKICKGAAALKRHIRITHNTPYQVCEVCGKSVKRNGIHLHQLKHGEKTFRCEHCLKMFSSKQELIVHERIHSGKKPYKCKHCGQAFTQAGTRKIHERIHTNERPFICEVCGKGFTSRGVLNVHTKKCHRTV